MENKTIKEFSELVSSSSPVPGGGGVCAAVSSLAASLGQMVTNLTIGKTKYLEYTVQLEDYKNQLETLRKQLLECINKDAQAFEPLAQIYKLDKNSTNYETKKEKYLIQAAQSPYQILLLTTKIIDIDTNLVNTSSLISVSDAATSVMLAHGVLYGAYINILANTRLMKDRTYANNLNNDTLDIVNKYSNKALTAFNEISKRLNKNG